MNDLSAALLEQHVLAALRVLGLYHTTTPAERSDFLPQIHALGRNLRALGFALDGRHGQSWTSLLQEAQVQLAVVLERGNGTTTASVLSGQALAVVLALKHGPTDARLAPPGLGLDLVTLAVATEHLLVLGSDSREPEAPDLTALSRSPREEALLEVTRQLAALTYQDTLPPGHRATAASLQEAAGKLREVRPHPDAGQGPGAGLVVRHWDLLADNPWKRRGSVLEPSAVGAVSMPLLRSLITADGSPVVLKHDTALALALEAAADALVPSRVTGP